MTLPLKDYAIGGAVIAVLAFGVIEYKAIEHKGAIKELTRQTEARIDTLAKDTARTAQEARQKVADAEQARKVAERQIVAGRALQKATDSLARSAADEREAAKKVLADSQATLASVRAELTRVVVADEASAAGFHKAHSQDSTTISALVNTVSRQDVALTAERQHSASLQALNASLTKELGLVRSQMPSGFGKVVWGVAGLAGGYFIGRGSK